MKLTLIFSIIYILSNQLISNSAEEDFPPFPYPVKSLQNANKNLPKIGQDIAFIIAQKLAIMRSIRNYKCKCVNGFAESALNLAASAYKVHFSHNTYYVWNGETGTIATIGNSEDVDMATTVLSALGSSLFESLFDAIFGFKNLSLEKNFGSILGKIYEIYSLIAEKKPQVMINTNGFVPFGKIFKGTKHVIIPNKCSVNSLLNLPSIDVIVKKLESHSLHFKYFDKLFGSIHLPKPLGVHFDVRLVDRIPQGIQTWYKINYKKDLDLDKSQSLISAAISSRGLKSVKL